MDLNKDLAAAEQRLADERKRLEAQREVANALPARAIELLYMIHPYRLYDQRGSMSARDLKPDELRELFALLPPIAPRPSRWERDSLVTIHPTMPEPGYVCKDIGGLSSFLLEIEESATWTWWTRVNGDLYEVNIKSDFPWSVWGAMQRLGIQLLRSTDQNGNVTRDDVKVNPPAIKAATRGLYGKWRRREFLFSCDDATVLAALD